MNWNELEKVWRAAPVPAGAPAVDAAEFPARRRKLARALARRDWLEAGTGFLVAAAFAGFLGWLRVSDWRGWTAVLLVLAVSAFFVRERRRARQLRPGPEAPLLAQLEGEIAELRHQRRLLRGVAGWYLLPLSTAALLFAWALLDFVAAKTGHFDTSFLLKFSVGALGLDVAVWWLNCRAVATEIEPRLRECEAMRADLAG